MSQYCITVSGGTRARFFTLEDVQFPEIESGPNLVEVNDMVNPEHDTSAAELWSDSKSGGNRAPGGAHHGYDDHRGHHDEEFERRFARDIAQEATRLLKRRQARNMVLVAHTRMLGFLRNALGPLMKNGIRILELPKDLSKLSPMELHQHLARAGLIPERRQPAGPAT